MAFKVILLEGAKEFLQNLPVHTYQKILYNLDRVAGGEINSELFKKLDNSDIWEFRTIFNGIAYRLFAFWDTSQRSLVVVTHGIIKKTQKHLKKRYPKLKL